MTIYSLVRPTFLPPIKKYHTRHNNLLLNFDWIRQFMYNTHFSLALCFISATVLFRFAFLCSQYNFSYNKVFIFLLCVIFISSVANDSFHFFCYALWCVFVCIRAHDCLMQPRIGYQGKNIVHKETRTLKEIKMEPLTFFSATFYIA